MKRYFDLLKNNRASVWKRGLAYIIDLLVINFVIVYPFQSLLNKTPLSLTSLDFKSLLGIDTTQILVITAIIGILSIAYWSILEYRIGQSLGKIILNLKVETKGELTFMQALIRNLSKPFLFIMLIDVIYMGFSHEKQRLFEKWSKTWVIQE